MKKDIILAGVGGQGILTIANIIDQTALALGLSVKQNEIHGMSQRGGAVQSHVRISSDPIYSDLIPRGQADLILSVEPLEALRYLDYLALDGIVVTNTKPFKNISTYPAETEIFAALEKIPGTILVDAENLAQTAGNIRTQNIVMVGAAAPFLELSKEMIGQQISGMFQSKGDAIILANMKAFELGWQFGSRSR